MKNKTFILFTIFSLTIANTFAQLSAKVEFGNAARDHLGSPKKVKSIDDKELAKTAHLQYSHLDYKKAYTTTSKEVYLLRYNIYSDEMEFVKNNQIYDLFKKENQIIDFFESKTKYVAFDLNGKLNYFLIKSSGKNLVLAKQTIKLEKGKKKVTQFDIEVKPKYYLGKDKLFIAFNNKNLQEIPKKKKTFYNLFGDKSSEIKKFMKKNRLSHKKGDDLVKITNYFSSIN
ncbi:MAG: hypothetical protein V3V28_09860 [Polaribacter sp.]|uniref:hypothetical protein n=1 Tax=Polaribacter sp. TaxID=1920175 RepID=UPI002F36104C